MILVELKAPISSASLVMGAIKSALLLGHFAGGWVSGKISGRVSLLTAFLISAVGYGAMAFPLGLLWLGVFAVMAQFGSAVFLSSTRILLVELVPPKFHQEAIGWLRSGNNFGNVVCFSLGAISSSLGFSFLLLVNSFTSLLAFLVGWKWLPKMSPEFQRSHSRDLSTKDSAQKVQRVGVLFFVQTLILCSYNFLYEIFIISTSAKLKLVYPEGGLRYFSIFMVANTVLCAVLAVPAAKKIKSPIFVKPLAFLLLMVGGILSLQGSANLPMVFLGFLMVTFSEILFGALAQYLLIEITHFMPSPGSSYGLAMSLQAGFRILSGLIAFPLVVHGNFTVLLFTATLIPVFIFMIWARRDFQRFLHHLG